MCGLVGVIGAPSRVNRQIFQDMLCMGVKRGPHSTGIAAANRKGAFIIKDVGLPWDLLRAKDYHEQIVNKNWPILMGHNRWATIGKIKKENAHPFWHKHIVLMHNGTLDPKGSNEDLDKWIDFDTDSECLAWNIAEHGIKEIYKKISGAWTLAWYDQKDGILNVVTNGQRPFQFITSVDKHTLFWASEEWIIRFAAEGRDIALDKSTYHLLSHKLYKFSINKKGIVEYMTEDLETKYDRAYTFISGKDYTKERYMGYGMEGLADEEMDGFLDWRKDKDIDTTGVKKSANIVPLLDHKGQIVGADSNVGKEYPHGSAMSLFKTEAEFKTKHGADTCTLCGCELHSEYKDALIIDPETVACGSCHQFCELNSICLV